MSKIKVGDINETEFLELFATQSQINTYNKTKCFKGKGRDNVMKKALLFCDIEYTGNKQYIISKVYDKPKPKEIGKMQSSLYKYIIPLILEQLIVGHDENNKISFTCGRCAREINMINCNYNLLKNNKEFIGDDNSNYILNINNSNLNDFYEKADSMINSYINKALDYLKKSGSIIWQKVYITQKEKIDNDTISENANGEYLGEILEDKHKATDEELQYYSQCIKVADEKSGLLKAFEKQSELDDKYMSIETMRYYSKYAKLWGQILSQELKKENIKYIYQAYEAYYISLNYCNNLAKEFKDFDNIEKLTTDFNQEFKDMIMTNANVRYEKQKEKYNNNYLIDFENLTSITIDHTTENIYERFEDAIEEKNSKKIKFKKKKGEII